eukprot:212994_1
MPVLSFLKSECLGVMWVTMEYIAKLGPKFRDTALNLVEKGLLILSNRLPRAETVVLHGLDIIFAPRLLLRHLVLACVFQSILLAWRAGEVLQHALMSRFSNKWKEITDTQSRMRQAKTYEEWRTAAERLDVIKGHDKWRQRPECTLYDHQLLQREISQLNEMIHKNDIFRLIFKLRGGLSRSQHGMLHEGLFSRAHAGTKLLVESYHDTVANALRCICTSQSKDIPNVAKLAFFNETRHAYGRTALMLSGGAMMGLYHTGVLKALIENNMLPRVLSGASAGSICASLVSTRNDSEWKALMMDRSELQCDFLKLVKKRRKEKKEKCRIGNESTSSGIRQGYWKWCKDCIEHSFENLWDLLYRWELPIKMDTEHFRQRIHHNIGDFTFQEAFDHSGRILNIIVSPKNNLTDPPRLLNYLTAPHVLVWSAVICSCSAPGLFDASPLLVKEENGSIRPEKVVGNKYCDGSIEADLPMQQLTELFNINHFIVSQVNPHALLLGNLSFTPSVWSHSMWSLLVGLLFFLKLQIRNWFRGVIEFVSLQTVAPVWTIRRKGVGLHQVLMQEYDGRNCDVTILPWDGCETVLSTLPKLLRNFSNEELDRALQVAQSNTWPQIEKIRSHCAIEMELEKCVNILRQTVEAENRIARHRYDWIHPGNLQNRDNFTTSRSYTQMCDLLVMDPVESISRSLSTIEKSVVEDNSDVMKQTESGDESNDEHCDQKKCHGGSQLITEKRHTHGSVARNPMMDHLPHTSSLLKIEEDLGEDQPLAKSISMSNFYYMHSSSSNTCD